VPERGGGEEEIMIFAVYHSKIDAFDTCMRSIGSIPENIVYSLRYSTVASCMSIVG